MINKPNILYIHTHDIGRPLGKILPSPHANHADANLVALKHHCSFAVIPLPPVTQIPSGHLLQRLDVFLKNLSQRLPNDLRHPCLQDAVL